MSSQKYPVRIIRLEIVAIEFLPFMESGVWFLALVHFHSNTFIALYRLHTHAFLIICFFVHLWKLCMLYIYVYMYVCVQLVPKQCWCGNNFTITILVSQSCDLIFGFLMRFRCSAFDCYVYMGLHWRYTCVVNFAVSLLKKSDNCTKVYAPLSLKHLLQEHTQQLWW